MADVTNKTKTGEAMSATGNLRVERRDEVAVVFMNVPGEAMNTLKADFTEEFGRVFDELEADASVSAVVFASDKPGSFIAGANIDMLDAVQSEADAVEISRAGQRAMDRIERFPKRVVAAIDGACLGGGLEVALACHERIASTDRKTKIGLPESQIGLLPGAGGTQRLPRLIGVQAALDLMLTGKQVDGKKAKKLGIVKDAVPPGILIDVAVKEAKASPKRTKSWLENARATLGDKDELTDFALSGNPLGRKVLFDQARKQLHKKTRGNYPAQDRILDVVRVGLERGFEAGLEAEAKGFGALVMSPESAALRSIFFATQALKKDNGVADPDVEGRKVERVGMLGAGLMGAGIAYVSALNASTSVRLKDRDSDGLLSGLRYVQEIVDGRVKRRRLTKMEAARVMRTIGATTSYEGFGGCDLVIEAVFEDLELKRSMVRDVERHGPDNVIYASNTSSLPIAAIAEASAHPETVIGMHYFSPVHKMPLLEIVVHPGTADWVTATCVKLGKAQGKTVIVVGDGPGFYTTRILAPLMNEAAHLLGEGAPIDEIDRAMLDFGFPVGPLKLTDEVGIDVGAKVGKVMVGAFGQRMAAPEGFQKLIDDERKGRKNGRGFYRYEDKKSGVDESVYEVLGIQPKPGSVSAEDIAWRCTLAMVNEAARTLEEGILRSPRDGDIGAIFGLGFPPFRGGPFRFVDAEGADEIVRRLRSYEAKHGERFTPCESLVRMAKSGEHFHAST
ncbi:MAG: 3-hydroxyacyl-CoA dehydrogenase/enoyl-CoA hydratase/3-hydroxybutyryl-CoA epimerase [Polyangiales bacterium]|jgi:3-hydroxyacyl-CoA dehydrogenase/enoyl-CoA hydratase/3-hydroxybutyryl-CoA epimerase